MSSSNFNDQLTARQKDLCEYGGVFGVLLSLTCLIQHFIFAIPGKVTNPMIPVYFFAIAAFIFLALQKTISIILLMISAFLSLIVTVLWLTHFSFSLAVLLLLLYHVVLIVLLFDGQIPRKLKLKKIAESSEENFWEGKI